MTNTAPAPKKKKRLSMHQKQSLAGWAFLTPATLLIFIMSFYPMFSALLTSFKRGKPTALVWSEPLWRNYQFMLKDKVFIQSVTNTLTYLIIQVPIMLILAVIFASLLNNRDLKFRGLFRTCIFLPCATGLVAYSMIFRTLFTYDGLYAGGSAGSDWADGADRGKQTADVPPCRAAARGEKRRCGYRNRRCRKGAARPAGGGRH